jgi:radical SAM protein with 4Fe4S-binding SPASM domain
VRQIAVFENRPEILIKLAARLSKGGRRLSFCYEAGPCGYGLRRLPTGCGHDCVVVAPSLIPVKAGDRVKTDRRDALMLAKLHRAGELTSIWIRYDPFADAECLGCIALPVCMGGCAHHAMDPRQRANRCGTFRHTYREQVLAYVKANAARAVKKQGSLGS